MLTPSYPSSSLSPTVAHALAPRRARGGNEEEDDDDDDDDEGVDDKSHTCKSGHACMLCSLDAVDLGGGWGAGLAKSPTGSDSDRSGGWGWGWEGWACRQSRWRDRRKRGNEQTLVDDAGNHVRLSGTKYAPPTLAVYFRWGRGQGQGAGGGGGGAKGEGDGGVGGLGLGAEKHLLQAAKPRWWDRPRPPPCLSVNDDDGGTDGQMD
ncbi:hypothetical protein MARPO_0058s0010 [Marchantia polymorpha]|uniref:Uncharacterized protein n=1 Tax=Marchantia polymorpha TaxID=3197 RepID=A0A2R6WTM2_MARPO|nr:hypothetical protein MARPO_0058s0010 [Marchantia polymorpha]|eukprot:PTQ37218.1 hypothetical protein MARPO_0058s0010 [Marchantia polymorpha]